MDVSLGLSQAVAAAAAMAFENRRTVRPAGTAYPLDSGRLLLSVSLLRKTSVSALERPETPPDRIPLHLGDLAEAYQALLAPGVRGFPAMPVRLLPARRAPVRRSVGSLIRGFEAAWARPVQAVAASALLAFGLAALMAGPQSGRAGVPLAGDPGGALEPARWSGQVLLADITAPHPHTFQRGWIKKYTAHSNSIQVTHANTPQKAHVNTFEAHANTPQVAHSNSPLVAHSNTPLVAHSNSPLVAHANTALVAHSNTPFVAHSNSPLVAHSNTPLVAHANTALVPHTNTDSRPYK